MQDVIITGASRGIGRALASALAARPRQRSILVARDTVRLDALAAEIARTGGQAVAVPGDLSSAAGARALGERLCSLVSRGSTLVHNAGLWPSRRVTGEDGLEQAFAVNFLGPLLLQQPLLAADRLARVMLVSAGAAIKGRVDPVRTPTGGDFSALRTYCTTKLCSVVGMRDVARAHPSLDVVVLHPGVVRTELGDRRGALGALLRLVKRGWEAPETCAARLVRILDRPRWGAPGEAAWLFEETEQPWPAAFEDPGTRAAVRQLVAQFACA